ncbi:MAG: hypothetical protein RR540_02420 [Oscillospiraceae bacterium]
MITRLETLENASFSPDYYGRKLRSWAEAYSTSYDFCKFYQAGEAPNSAIIGVLNSAMVISGNPEISDEIEIFIRINTPETVELEPQTAKKIHLREYSYEKRALFRFESGTFPDEMDVQINQNLEEFYKIFQEGFNISTDYSLWLTDTSHRIRHEISRVFRYKNTIASEIFNSDGKSFFGMITTVPQDRGKGNARELLYWLENFVAKNGNSAELFARENRISYYTELGFTKICEDVILERKLK